jgi:hypothetical protein
MSSTTKDWLKAKEKLIVLYAEKGIVRCERCGSTQWLSFHHLDKRSTGRAKHTFDGTRLLCIPCHEICEFSHVENEKLEKKKRIISLWQK